MSTPTITLEKDVAATTGAAAAPHHTISAGERLDAKQSHLVMLAAVALPPIGAVAAMVSMWGSLFDWTNLILLVVMYCVTGLGITIGYHRLFTHRAFATPTLIGSFLMICGGMAAQGPLIWWAATHRRHHQHSDEEMDPHSPHAARTPGVRGWLHAFAHAHFGWLFRTANDDNYDYVPDLIRHTTIRRLNRLFPLWVALGFALPAAVGGLVSGTWEGAALGVLWGGFTRMFFLHHTTWSINSVCHIWGWRDFRCSDESRNNPILGIATFGEGWHNNHHAFPTSARHGLKWWQLDVSWIIIRSLGFFGLATKIRVPSPQRMLDRAL